MQIVSGITITLAWPQLRCCEEKRAGPVAIIYSSLGQKAVGNNISEGWKFQATLSKNYFGLRGGAWTFHCHHSPISWTAEWVGVDVASRLLCQMGVGENSS